MCFTTDAFLENICRTCMAEGEYDNTISIFNETDHIEDNNATIMDLLVLTTPQLNIETKDMLPKVLCENCLKRLINAHEFQKMCIRSEEILRQIFSERTELQSQVSMDPSNNGATVNQAINELTNELKVVMNNDVPLFDIKTDDESENVKYKIEGNQCSSDSVQFEDDISSEWEVDTIKVTSPEKRSETLNRKVSKVCSSSPKIIEQNFQTKNSHANINEDVESKPFVCEECGNRLKTKKSLKRHKKIHLRPLADSRSKPRTTRHECEFCKKVFQQSYSLKEHLRKHTGEQPYLCSECGKAFKSSSNLKQHLLRHGTDRPHACPDCPKRFPCFSDLASHKIVHNKKKSHVCVICGAGFYKPYLLKKHTMYHTGEKNHKCDYCEMRFVSAYHCRRHMRTHTGEKPYKCKYCEREFAQSNDLMKHLRGHLGDNVYKCDLCPRGFRLQGDLRIHFYTHKNDDEETRARNLQALKDEEKRIQMKFELVECKK